MGMPVDYKPPTAGKMVGPTPPLANPAKPANSVKARATVEASLIDGPYGGKKPQS